MAMLLTIFALLLVSAMAIALLEAGTWETQLNDNHRNRVKAHFASVAGLEEVRERLTPGNPAPHFILGPTALPGGPGSVVYVLNPAGGSDVVAPTDPNNRYFDNELCRENFPGLGFASNTTCTQASSVPGVYAFLSSDAPFTGTPAALEYKWVRITLKSNSTLAPFYVNGGSGAATLNRQACYSGMNEMLPPPDYLACDQPPAGTSRIFKPVYILTSLAVTATGSRRMTQMEVAAIPPFIGSAAIDSQDHVTLNGQLTVNSYDYCSCSCTTDKQGNTTCTSRDGQTCDTSKYAIFSSSTVDKTNSSQNLISGQNPPVKENQAWPYDIPALIDMYRSMAAAVDVRNTPYNYVCSGSPLNCGTKSGQVFGVPPYFPPNPPENPAGPSNMAPQITYIPGNLQITGNTQGNGVLLVDGDLNISGGLQFYGLVIVKGVIKFSGGGSQSTNIYGQVLAGEESLVDSVLGGSANITFDACSLKQPLPPQPPQVISFRELY
ncbi:MAG TPA: hypothetical protein VNK82_05825 [Terriglobales bacterium]|nr:hypothetical protein [Terriglobales bacterium]